MPEHIVSCYPVDKIKFRQTWRELFLTLVKYTILVQKKEKREKKLKRHTKNFAMLAESKQTYARGAEDYSEEQLIPIKRLDSTILPRPVSSWIISCMCWLEGTALTCNT